MAVLAAVWLGMHLWSCHRADQALKEHLEALRAAGKPTTLADMAPRPVAVDRNAAPLYQRAAIMLERSSPGAYDAAPGWGAADLGAKGVCVDRDRGAFELARQGSLRPECQFPGEWRDGAFLQKPDYGQMHNLARFLAWSAVAAAGRDDGARAAESLRIGFALSRHLGCAPQVSGPPTMRSMDAVMVRAAKCVLGGVALPVDAAERLSQELDRARYAPRLTENLINIRRCFTVTYCDNARSKPAAFASGTQWAALGIELPYLRDVEADLGAIGAVSYAKSSELTRDESVALKLCDEFERLAALPYRAFFGRWRKLCESHPCESWLQPQAWVTSSGDACVRDRDEAIAGRDLLRAAIAVEGYRAQRGRYPAALSDAGRTGLPIPEDVFGGKAFGYRPNGNSYVLYSVGPNLQDDGGRREADGPADDIRWRRRGM